MSHMCDTFKSTRNLWQSNRYIFVIVFEVIIGYNTQFRMIYTRGLWWLSHKLRTFHVCKVVIISAVCGIGPIVTYISRSVANVLTTQPIKLTITWTSRSPKPAWVGSMIRSVGMEAGTPLSVNAGPEIFTFLGSQRGLTFIWKGL